MKFIVNDIRFDFSGSDDVTMNEKIDITDDSLGLWDADDEDDLIEEITTATGWCISSIDYEIQLT
ncbi:MAG: hypothetical protein VW270_10020 [Candidatus Poseidoniales archaeon]